MPMMMRTATVVRKNRRRSAAASSRQAQKTTTSFNRRASAPSMSPHHHHPVFSPRPISRSAETVARTVTPYASPSKSVTFHTETEEICINSRPDTLAIRGKYIDYFPLMELSN
ncbi:hypothetical protein LOTGIDRAFT_153478 [Lottia gigantea]|uniref:Uncharacterized protein n=1 Tax=Lottia gigantea TaxID=225164 RepID=V4AKC4_LOTGI|nr:hypothetical protein LOTGIDRAFT_153478 [Lottia gigantea]ESO94001.1 hypothetical protein LOTGIDRAFT_153478 [Lottia gigantea]